MTDLTDFVTERETTISYSPGDPVVRIWTNVAKHVRAFRKDPAYTERRAWAADPSKEQLEAVSFEIRRDLYDPVRGRRRPRGPKAASAE